MKAFSGIGLLSPFNVRCANRNESGSSQMEVARKRAPKVAAAAAAAAEFCTHLAAAANPANAAGLSVLDEVIADEACSDSAVRDHGGSV